LENSYTMKETILLENETLKATFKTLGAELCSLIDKRTNTEHIWQADPKVWARHAPILFPIVGQLENNKYQVDGKEYQLTQHGFARDCAFEILEENKESVVYSLHSSSETETKYPFKFRLDVVYTLSEDTLSVGYKVFNKDEKVIYFSIGAHTGFTCPFYSDDLFSDYYFEFQQNETVKRLLFSDGLLNGEESDFLQHQKQIPLSYELFAHDAIILQGLQSEWVDLKSKTNKTTLRFYFKDFPLLAFWTKPGASAPFICIEPWFGIADIKGRNKPYSKKDFIQSLEINQEFTCSHEIRLLS
jgi:galactose mutarotase-like enzyme